MAIRKVTIVKVATSNSSNATGESLGVITRNEFASSTPRSASSDSFTSNMAPVMVTNATTLEEQIASLTKAIEGLMKHVQEQDSQMTKLMNKVDNASTSRIMGKQVEAHDEAETSMKQQPSERVKSFKELQVSSDGLIPADQLKEFIMGTIKDKFDGSSKSYLTYTKPYTQRIDNLRMPVGYQPLKFQHFDGKGNPKQHVAHFIETCNNARTYEDYLFKQFVQSLKGNAFDWYTDLEFLNRFCSTRQIVSMIELTNSRQWKEEPVIDYINRWRNLSLNCKDRLSEASAIEMCIQGMHWGLQYILQGIQPKTFEELVTRAHDIKLSMAASGVEGPPIQEPHNFFSKNPSKESMAVNTTPIKLRGNANDKSGEKKDISQEIRQRKLTLKEMQAMKYLFLNSDVSGIFNDLLNANLIELPKMKRPEEAGQIDDPKYCKYHRLVGHPIHDYFIFKDKVMQLAHQGKITLEEDNAATNLFTIAFGSLDVIMENVPGWNGGRRLDYGNDVSCNMTSDQMFSLVKSVYLGLGITFSDEDLLLGSKPHNRPLFVTGYTREQKVNRILIDGGSTINILPLRTIKELGVSMDELGNSRLMIQYFNQGGQRAFSIIRLKLLMDDMTSTVLFHVIDAKTLYNMLFGCPWLHENGVYCREGVVKIVLGDDKPFTEAESHFTDAKYYLKNAKSTKVKESLFHEQSNQQDDPFDGEKCKETLSIHYDGKLVLPLTKLDTKKPSPQPLKGFVRPIQGPEKEYRESYKLLIKAGYDPQEDSSMGKLSLEATSKQAHVLNATQKLLKEKGYAIQNTQTGIGASSNHITEDGFSSTNNAFDEKEKQRVSIFDRLDPLRKLGVSKMTKHLKKADRPRATQKLQSLILSRMRQFTTLTISCDKVLKVKLQIIVFTRTQDNKEDDRENNVVSMNHITLTEEVSFEEEDAEAAPPELEEGDTSNPRPTYISTLLTNDEEKTYIELLHKFKDVFSWSYKEIPGLNPKVAVHHLSVKKGARPIKQAQCRFWPELVPLIEVEVNKLIEIGFIREVKYPTWISSIVPIRKKNGQIRVCVDFRDLNGHEALSFIDGSSGYNQIRMAPKDEELTAFRTPKGIYCYKVMLFGLKNTGATYQRAMQKIFDDMLYKNIECYVDDVVVKKVFECLRRYELKMNPLKCAFGVKSRKFLGFIVRHRGIEIEQAKSYAILKMPEPRNIHELKSLQGKLAYLQRFISNLADRCQPFSHHMKQGISFEWDESCRNAFKSIKAYLMKPPVLAAPVPGRPLILYIAAQYRSVGALLAQENNDGKESALYYLSRMMTPNELNYSLIEKICLALIFVIQKLKYYFQAHIVLLADFLEFHHIPIEWELSDDLPDEDILVIEVTPSWKIIAILFHLNPNCSNNVAECRALILGLKMTVDIKQLHLDVYGDSKLVVNQLFSLYKVKKHDLLPYCNYAKKLIGWLGDIVIDHVPRKDNKQANALANLTSTFAIPEVVPPIFEDESCDEEEENHAVEVFEIEKEDWHQPLVNYLKYEKLSNDPRPRVDIRCRAARFIYYNGRLYRRSFDEVFLRCLGDDEAIQAMEEAHSGICGAHQLGPKLYF
ncbi:hypothetical protein Pfo_003582 [Paulownia fortunei]|nr:hypothetical protein Pfo_003582 [Paulownia fortunei]